MPSVNLMLVRGAGPSKKPCRPEGTCLKPHPAGCSEPMTELMIGKRQGRVWGLPGCQQDHGMGEPCRDCASRPELSCGCSAAGVGGRSWGCDDGDRGWERLWVGENISARSIWGEDDGLADKCSSEVPASGFSL